MPVLNFVRDDSTDTISTFITCEVSSWTETKQNICMYEVKIKCRTGDSQTAYSVSRRYNQFRTLRDELSPVIFSANTNSEPKSVTKFPSKKMFNSKRTKDKRRTYFNEYLKNVLDQSTSSSHALDGPLGSFLELENNLNNLQVKSSSDELSLDTSSSADLVSESTTSHTDTSIDVNKIPVTPTPTKSTRVVSPALTPASAHKYPPLMPTVPLEEKLNFFLSHLQAGFIVKKTDTKGKTRPLVLFCDSNTASFVYYRRLMEADFQTKGEFDAFIKKEFTDVGNKNKPVKRNDPLALLDLEEVETKTNPSNSSSKGLILHFKNAKFKAFTKSLTLSFFSEEDFDYVKAGFDAAVDNKESFESVEIIRAAKKIKF